ncbi:MAG: hypothetical protein ABJN65_07460 [Parasphingorhabdus sp.]
MKDSGNAIARSLFARWITAVLCAALLAIGGAASLVLAVGLFERFDLIGLILLFAWLTAMGAIFLRMPLLGREWGLVVFIAALSLMLRYWSATLTLDVALGADPMNYTNLAMAVLEGRGLITDDWHYGDDLRAYFPPLYPLALAGFWWIFGTSAWSTLAMNTAIDCIAAWALGDAGRRLYGKGSHGKNVGLVAGIAYFAWPAFALGAGIPQKEALTLLFIILLLRTMVVWMQADVQNATRWRHGLFAGLWWGLLSLTQPSLALAPGFVGLILVWQKGFMPVVFFGLKALPALLLVLMPWWIRNWILFGTFIPFTTASGMMLNSAWRDLRVPFPSGLFDLPEPERASIMGAKAAEAIGENPLEFAKQALVSMTSGFAYEEAPLARYRHTTPPIGAVEHAQLAPVLQGSYAALLLSAMAGTWAQFRMRHVDPILLYAFVLLTSIVMVNFWFEFGERHRLALTPFLILLAASFWLSFRSIGKDAPAEQA